MRLDLRPQSGNLPDMTFGKRTICALLALALGGGHWAALQTIAWSGMLVARVQKMSFKEALATTFDGDHPCSMCAGIEKARDTDRANDAPQTFNADLKPLIAVLAPATLLPPPPRDGVPMQRIFAPRDLPNAAPPVPPPRALA